MEEGPTLREATERRFEDLQRFLEERDKRYSERFEAQQEALKTAVAARNHLLPNILSVLAIAVSLFLALRR